MDTRGPRVGLLAVTAGISVANLYYNQPLLPLIGRSFGYGDGRTGIVSTTTQIGYAIGLLLFVPLGDVLERRRLMAGLLVAVAISLAAAAAAPTLGFLAVASLAVGITTVVPQLIIPYGAGLVGATERGRVVGRIMAGVLIGILAARVVSGAVAAVAGWRAMFAFAAVTMLALAVALVRLLPASPPTMRIGYPALLRSVWEMARATPVLRDASIIGALIFLAFSAFWTTLAFRLEWPPLHYGSAAAGAFGLVGIVGATAAPLVGRRADESAPRRTVGLGLAVITVSYLVFSAFGSTIPGLVVGVIVLDAGMQVVNVSNQTRIYRLPAEGHSRLNTVYMTTYFIGGSLGSALGAWAWGHWHWVGVNAVALGSLAAAVGIYITNRRVAG